MTVFFLPRDCKMLNCCFQKMELPYTFTALTMGELIAARVLLDDLILSLPKLTAMP